jgi:hypothetical protein
VCSTLVPMHPLEEKWLPYSPSVSPRNRYAKRLENAREKLARYGINDLGVYWPVSERTNPRKEWEVFIVAVELAARDLIGTENTRLVL